MKGGSVDRAETARIIGRIDTVSAEAEQSRLKMLVDGLIESAAPGIGGPPLASVNCALGVCRDLGLDPVAHLRAPNCGCPLVPTIESHLADDGTACPGGEDIIPECQVDKIYQSHAWPGAISTTWMRIQWGAEQ